MEDKPKGKGEEQAGASKAPQSPPPPLPAEKAASDSGKDPKTGSAKSDAEKPPKSKWKRAWSWVWPMDFSDAVMIVLTIAIAVGTLVSAAAIYLQWREMVKGGADTSALVGYAQRQADDADKIKLSADKQAVASQQFADNAALINNGVGDAVKKLDAQAKATQGSANAAQSAAKTADKALHISERAYVVAGQPTIDTGTKYISLPIINNGHIPSGKVRAIIHEVTLDGADPAAVHASVIPSTEAHWKHYEMEPVPTTFNQTRNFTVFVPALNVDNLNSGREQIIVVGVITYSDGFPDDTEQQWPFCYGNAMLSQSKALTWALCDSSFYLPQAIQADHYPNNEYAQ